jgi:hypothetical protein
MANENKYLDLYNLLQGNGTLWKICEIAALKAAWDILNEDSKTAHHNERKQWAHNIIGSPSQWVNANRYKILQNATVCAAGDNATDSDVQFVINQLVPV